VFVATPDDFAVAPFPAVDQFVRTAHHRVWTQRVHGGRGKHILPSQRTVLHDEPDHGEAGFVQKQVSDGAKLSTRVSGDDRLANHISCALRHMYSSTHDEYARITPTAAVWLSLSGRSFVRMQAQQDQPLFALR
jgi:hypothetical protein